MAEHHSGAAADSFQEFLCAYFPMAIAMQVTVDVYTEDEVVLRAPLAPNRNVHQTSFAGSLYSLGALAGWGLTHGWLDRTDAHATLVIGRGEIRYLNPVRSEFIASASLEDGRVRDAFLEAVSLGKRAELELEAGIFSESKEVAIFKGQFIVTKRERYQ